MIATISLNLGDARCSFQYRKGTRDEVVVVHVLSNSAYNFGRLRRGKELLDLYERLSGTGKAPLIIDIGAGIGASTLYFAHSFPRARVVAVEPDQSDFELLAVNTSGLPVEVLGATVGPSAMGAGGKEPYDDLPIRAVAPEKRDGVGRVPRVTVNDILERHAQECELFVVKLNLESSEDDLFSVNTEWLARTPVLIVDLCDSLIPGSENIRKFVEYISNFKRDFVYLQDSIFSIGREFVVT